MRGTEMDDWSSGLRTVMDASKRLDAMLGSDWPDSVPESLSDNPEARVVYRDYVDGWRTVRRCLGPETVIPGSNKVLKDFIETLKKASSLKPDLKHYWGLLKEQLEEFEDEYGIDLVDRLTTMKYFDPDGWVGRLDEFCPLHIKGAGVPKWVVNRYQEAVYAYVYGFYNASVSLCRSVIEGVLRIKLEGRPGINKDTKLNVLIEFFFKTLRDVGEGQATFRVRAVKKMADGVLHDIKESARVADAKRILSCTKDFIEAVHK